MAAAALNQAPPLLREVCESRIPGKPQILHP